MSSTTLQQTSSPDDITTASNTLYNRTSCIDDLCNSIIASCTKAANITIPSCKPKSVASEVPGWSDEVEPERNRSLFWHWIWLESDKPRSGFVYDIMKRTRHRYHYAIRSCKKQKQDIQKRKLVENISNSKDFWSEIKKLTLPVNLFLTQLTKQMVTMK